MWIHLGRCILTEFARFGAVARRSKESYDFSYRVRDTSPARGADLAWKLALKSVRLRKARVAVAAGRPPCPHCGGKVERLGTTGTPPIYCSPAHMRAAKWKRWRERHPEYRRSRP